MTTFACIHGAHHRGAHFDLLAGELRARGHAAVAPDLPTTDPGAGAAAYAAAVVSALDGGGDDLVLVAHSMGGLIAPVVAGLRAVRRIVFLAALVPRPGRSFDEVAAADRSVYASHVHQTSALARPDGSAEIPFARACEVFYHDCGFERQRWAHALLRPQHWKPSQEPSPLERRPDVPATFVVCAADRLVNPEWLRATAGTWNADVVEIAGGHCPFVSRPAALADLLVSIR